MTTRTSAAILISLFEFCAVVFLGCSTGKERRPLYLVYNESGSHWNGSPASLTVYELRPGQTGLNRIWGLPDSTWVGDVYVFPDQELMVVEEEFYPKNFLDVFSLRTLTLANRYHVDSLGPVQRFKYYSTGRSGGMFVADFNAFVGTDSSREQHLLIWPDSTRRREDMYGYVAPGERRFAGGAPNGAIGGNDTFLRSIMHDLKVLKAGGYCAEAFPAPDSLIRFKFSSGWTLFAHEPSFLALCSEPGTNGQMEREVLIYDREARTWHSLIVPGDQTSLRPLNGWISGEIRFSKLMIDSNLAFAFGSPYKWLNPIPHDSAVIVNPKTQQMVLVAGGHRPEVLWVEEDRLYYRVEDTLFRAKIGEEGLVGRKVLLVDPKIKNVHWAFRRMAE